MTLRNALRRAVATSAIAAAVIGAGGTAMAESGRWYSKDKPMSARHDGKTLAQAYGNFYNSQGVAAVNSTVRRDVAQDGHAAYAESKWFFWGAGSAGGARWISYGKNQTARSGSNAWKYQPVRRSLVGNAERARVQAKVCIDRPNRPDRCADPATRTFDY